MKIYSYYSSLLVLLVLASSCGSKGDDPQPQADSYVRFKVNGVQKEFKVSNQPMGFSLDPGGPIYNGIVVINGNMADGTKNFITMTIRNETLFETGKDYEMQNPIKYKGIDMVRILFTYADEEGDIYNAVLFQQTIPGIKVTDDARVRFTKISQNWVEGNFDAVILGPVTTTGTRNTELNITDGTFSLPLVNNIP